MALGRIVADDEAVKAYSKGDDAALSTLSKGLAWCIEALEARAGRR